MRRLIFSIAVSLCFLLIAVVMVGILFRQWIYRNRLS